MIKYKIFSYCLSRNVTSLPFFKFKTDSCSVWSGVLGRWVEGHGRGLGSELCVVCDPAPPLNQHLIGSVDDKSGPRGRPQQLLTAVSSFLCKSKQNTITLSRHTDVCASTCSDPSSGLSTSAALPLLYSHILATRIR